MLPHITLAALIASPTFAASGGAFPAVLELTTLDGTHGFAINGIDVNDQSGFSVSSLGDVNGDGIDDIIIGAPVAEPSNSVSDGASYVLFGGHGVGSTGHIDLSSLNGEYGFIILGVNSLDQSGFSVSSAGDLNSDGINDILIGANGAVCCDAGAFDGYGAAYVVFGDQSIGSKGIVDLSSLGGTTGFTLRGIDPFDNAGHAVSLAGDLNGDEIHDIAIGAPGISNGESYVIFGTADSEFADVLDLSDLDGTRGFTLSGIDAGDRSGWSMAAAGDVDGDNFGDLLISAPFARANDGESGEVYLVFGSTDIGSDGAITLSSLDGSNGVVFRGDNTFDHAGASVSSAGDLNADGYDDILIGVPGEDPSDIFDAGAAYVVFGGPGARSAGMIDLISLDGSNGFILNGSMSRDRTGSVVSHAGDMNGDGVSDIAIGAASADPNGLSSGTTYVVFGRPGIGSTGSLDLALLDGTSGFIINGAAANDISGRSISSAGDINNDGVDDLAIGASGAAPNGVLGAGSTYVVFGRLANFNNDADLTNDGIVDTFDLAALLALWGPCIGCNADFNNDGAIDSFDLSVVLAAWG